MISQEKRIELPARTNAPATNLYCKILLNDSTMLGNKPVIILVPGGPGGNHAVYLPITEHLLQYSDLILFDPRGCGASDPSDAQYCSIDDYIDDIDAIRTYFNLNQITLLGGSYGAMASLGYATRYPDHLEKLILLAGAPSHKFIDTAKQNLEKRGTDTQKRIAKKLWDGDFKDANEFSDFYDKMGSLYSVNSNEAPPTTSPGIPYNIEVTNFGFKKFLRKFNFEDQLQNVTCETLIICGEDDWINDPSHSEFMAHKIKKSTLHIFQDCGHFAEIDQPKLFFETLSHFLGKTK